MQIRDRNKESFRWRGKEFRDTRYSRILGRVPEKQQKILDDFLVQYKNGEYGD